MVPCSLSCIHDAIRGSTSPGHTSWDVTIREAAYWRNLSQRNSPATPIEILLFFLMLCLGGVVKTRIKGQKEKGDRRRKMEACEYIIDLKAARSAPTAGATRNASNYWSPLASCCSDSPLVPLNNLCLATEA